MLYNKMKKQITLKSMWIDDNDDDDVVILEDDLVDRKKGRSNNKSNKWISSSFDGFGDFTDSAASSKSRKRPREMLTKSGSSGGATRRQTVIDDTLWVEKYAPKSVSELAVHKKKIEDVQRWIEGRFSNNTHGSHICLLTGPAGCGKTATVNAIKSEFDYELQEWSNPVTSGFTSFTQDSYSYRPFEGYTNESQSTVFQDFLLRANKYPTLQIFGGHHSLRKIILVEEFPNVFFRDVASFHNILRRYTSSGRCPLIFIVSDSAGSDSLERILFPKTIQTELNIANICFNPVAQTSMTKVLSRIASVESQQGAHRFTVPSKTTIDALATASNGDIRGAINALQFACLKDTHDIEDAIVGSRSLISSSSVKTKTKSERKWTKKGSFSKTKTAKSELVSIGGKDTSLFLFRAVGKILHCKRGDTSQIAAEPELPSHLRHHSRDPLLVNPEDVVERCHMSGDLFTAYLHQNYVDFFPDFDDIVDASNYLSDADYLTKSWQSREAMRDYAASVATRGLMFCKNSSAKSSGGGSGPGWKPLHKPQCFSVNQKAQNNKQTARMLFRKFWSTPEELQTQVLPFISLTDITLHDPGQIAFLHEVTKYPVSSFSSRQHPERLDEKDVCLEGNEESQHGSLNTESTNQTPDDSDNITNSQSKVNVSVVKEEEYDIEDFDDDF